MFSDPEITNETSSDPSDHSTYETINKHADNAACLQLLVLVDGRRPSLPTPVARGYAASNALACLDTLAARQTRKWRGTCRYDLTRG